MKRKIFDLKIVHNVYYVGYLSAKIEIEKKDSDIYKIT